MRDTVLKRAILISIAVHLIAVVFIGRTSSTRINAASMATPPTRLLNVDLVKDPLADPPKPAPVVRHETPAPEPKRGAIASIANFFSSDRRSSAAPSPSHSIRSNAGGALKTGTASRHGDLAGNWSGSTSVGRVSGAENGRGNGSGSDSGMGTPEPVRVDPPCSQEVYHPQAPPAPRHVSVRICEVSGMLVGDHCTNTRIASFIEGDEPRRVCDRCKAPEPKHESRLADRQNPTLTRDAKPRIPDSVDEGLTLEVEIDYYVDADGSVSGARISRSSGNRDLDRAVISAASQWRYNPAIQDGMPRRVKVTRSIKFRT